MTRRDTLPIGVVLAAWTIAATPGRAEDRPLTLPSRDVDVVYEASRTDAPGDQPKLAQRVRWDAAAQKLRVDTPSPGLFVVMDYRAHLLSAVRPEQRMVLQIHSDGAGLPVGGSASGFTRQGDDIVAGVACTEWRTQDSAGDPTNLCLTSDGVMLRARIGGRALVQAVKVTYGAIATDIFDVPQDYRRVTPGQKP